MPKCDFNKVAFKPNPHLALRANAEFHSNPSAKKFVA